MRGRNILEQIKANIEKVRKLKIQRPKSVKLLAEELHIDKESIRRIFIEDSKKRKLGARTVHFNRLNKKKNALLRAKIFLKCNGALCQPSDSPDLAPAYYFLFPKLKLKMNGHHFHSIVMIQKSVTEELRTILKNDFQYALERLTQRAQRCI